MLRFIYCMRAIRKSGIIISIHPMLRFIQVVRRKCIRDGLFQYIPCYGLSQYRENSMYLEQNFNTSHVTVYRSGSDAPATAAHHFNTSHVTVYQSISRDGL